MTFRRLWRCPTVIKLVTLLLVKARTDTTSVQILQYRLLLMQKATKDSSMDIREECLCLSGRRSPSCACCFLVETVTQVERWQLWCSSPASWHPVTESQQQLCAHNPGSTWWMMMPFSCRNGSEVYKLSWVYIRSCKIVSNAVGSRCLIRGVWLYKAISVQEWWSWSGMREDCRWFKLYEAEEGYLSSYRASMTL